MAVGLAVVLIFCSIGEGAAKAHAQTRSSITQDEKDEHDLALWYKVRLENVLSSDSQTNSKTNFDSCLHTCSHTQEM